METRLDPDFDSRSEQQAARLIADAFVRAGYEPQQNGRTGFERWVLGAAALLVVMGIGGTITMYGRLTGLESTVMDLKDSVFELRGQIASLENVMRNKP
jgi:hypothetical protein